MVGRDLVCLLPNSRTPAQVRARLSSSARLELTSAPREVKSQLQGLELNQVLQQHTPRAEPAASARGQLEAELLNRAPLLAAPPREASSRQCASSWTPRGQESQLEAISSWMWSRHSSPAVGVEAGGQPRLSPSSRHLMWSGSRSAVLARCSDPKLEDEAPNAASAGI
ncbi:UNVERIFIED_CONTAM: hypothetical protein Sradi_1719200 [Sesamum radiatum]|uniref:Uncharacterized protein n=1 Tax=Sesamum radiatum TaxID=300843 RepID=A0AAW2TSA2_SESRA